MSSNNTNHFGNPLVTGIVGNGSSSCSKQQYYNTSNNKRSSLKISPSSTARSAPIYLHHQFPESPRSAAIHHQLPTIVSPVPPYSRSSSSTSTSTSCISTTNEKTREPVDVPTGKISVLESFESRQDSFHQHEHRYPNHYPNKSFTYDSGSRSSSSRSLSIGLPSMYPVSSRHARNNSFESFLLEELQDFDEIFGSFRSLPPQQQQEPNNQI